MRIDLKIQCETPEFIPLQKLASRGSSVMAFFAPFLIFAALCWFRDMIDTMMLRKTLGVFYIGYKDTHWYWGVLSMVEVEILLAAGALRTDRDRGVSAVAFMVAIFVVDCWCKPDLEYARHTLGLSRELSGLTLVITGMLGMLLRIRDWKLQIGLEKFGPVNWLHDHAEVVCAFVAFINTAHIMYMVLLAIYARFAVSSKVIKDGGGRNGWFQEKYLRAITNLWGMNRMRLTSYFDHTTDTKQETMDVGVLNQVELQFLQFSMAEMLRTCADSSQVVSTGLIGRAAAHAIQQASGWRSAYLKSVAQQHPYADIKFDEANALKGATVDEVFMATQDVGRDVLNRHPAMAHFSLGDDEEVEEEVVKEVMKSVVEEDKYIEPEELRLPALSRIPEHDESQVQAMVEYTQGILSHRACNSKVALSVEHLTTQIRHADAEIDQLRIRRAGRQKEGIRQARLHEELTPRCNATRQMTNLGIAKPMIPTDALTLHTTWAKENKETEAPPSSLFSPRARGLAPSEEGVATSYWLEGEGANNNNNKVPLAIGNGPIAQPAAQAPLGFANFIDRSQPAQELPVDDSSSFGARLLGRFGWGAAAPAPAAAPSSAHVPEPAPTPAPAPAAAFAPALAPALASSSNTVVADEPEPRQGSADKSLPPQQTTPQVLAWQPAPAANNPTTWAADMAWMETGDEPTLGADEDEEFTALKLQFAGKLEAPAVGMFKTMLLAGIRKLGLGDDVMDSLRVTVSTDWAALDGFFAVVIEIPRQSLIPMKALEFDGLNVVGYVVDKVEWDGRQNTFV